MTTQSPLGDPRIAIIGLGYVGLPLAAEFGKHFDTLGFDINLQRIAELVAGQDRTHEVSVVELAEAKRLRFSVEAAALADRNVFIVTVPTPVDADRRPDFTPLIKASQTVGRALKRGDLVIYESTVYPVHHPLPPAPANNRRIIGDVAQFSRLTIKVGMFRQHPEIEEILHPAVQHAERCRRFQFFRDDGVAGIYAYFRFGHAGQNCRVTRILRARHDHIAERFLTNTEATFNDLARQPMRAPRFSF